MLPHRRVAPVFSVVLAILPELKSCHVPGSIGPLRLQLKFLGIAEDPEPISHELFCEELHVLFISTAAGPKVLPARIQHSVPGLCRGFAAVVHDFDPLRVFQQIGTFCVLRTVWVQREEHLMQLEVVLGPDVGPRRIGPGAAQVILLWPVAPHVLWMIRFIEFSQHLIQHLLIRLPQHHPGVDSGALPPRPSGLTLVLAQQDASAIDRSAVAALTPVVHPTPQGGRGREVEEVVDVLPDQKVNVHHQDLFILREPQTSKLREDMGEALFSIGKAELFHGHLNMADASALPEPRETLDVFSGHIFRKEAEPVVFGSGLPNGRAQHHSTQDVLHGAAPKANQVGIFSFGLRCDRGLRRHFLREFQT
mmetsp:Transcript_52147/g.113757  ORF Transcript_52147/g.113757 Transcript_52147/m.113757 type:complete len:364 (+) Transcript_52147:681-1772(+)